MKYPKINSLYKRDEKGCFIADFSQPEFDYLYDNVWVGHEKIDGTNIRAYINGDDVIIRGRTDNAQLHVDLVTTIKAKILSTGKIQEVLSSEGEVCLYGEGIGPKVQKDLYKTGWDFILFDVNVGGWWLRQEDVKDIATTLNLSYAPERFRGTLREAESIVKRGCITQIGETINVAEGLILRPLVEMRTRRGDRIITKLKTTDYRP